MNPLTKQPILVVGAGIAGVSAALEAAETGCEVILVDREPSIGGRVLRNHNYFPKLCPPACGMEINTRRLERNPRVRLLTNTRVSQANATAEGWSVTLTRAPAHVNDRCTACGECAKVCPTKVANPFNLEMDQTTAIRLPHQDAFPHIYVMDRSVCPLDCKACVDACKYNAIDLGAQETQETVAASAVIIATGWHPYPLEKLPELGAGQLKDVIANVNMERMVAPAGPTEGKILRPSNNQPPKKVAFVQCAGSRDVNHLAYCSGVCCLASLKQAIYVREQLPEAEVTMYYIDRRAMGRNEEMLTRVSEMEGVKLVKGKVGKVEQGAGDMLSLKLEDVEAGQLVEAEADLVVLATGMESNLANGDLPFNLQKDEDNFGLDNMDTKLIVAGVARRPEDVAACVRDATGAAAKAFIAARRS